MVKNGDTVEVDGVAATVETSWGQGRHVVYHLSDGREVIDLHELVKSGYVKLVPLSRQVKSKPLVIDIDSLKSDVDESGE